MQILNTTENEHKINNMCSKLNRQLMIEQCKFHFPSDEVSFSVIMLAISCLSIPALTADKAPHYSFSEKSVNDFSLELQLVKKPIT